MGTRKEIADILKQAATSYLLKKGFSCFHELGLNSWGKKRGDVVALNLRAEIVIIEVKSSVSDYATDSKWKFYLEFSNKMYFAFTHAVHEKLRDRLKADLKGTGVGVLVLDPSTGYLQSKMSAKRRRMSGKTKKNLVVRMAWRQGTSKRNSRRKRHFIA